MLDTNPKLAAQMHCDAHVVKMTTETAQILSTAHRLLDGQMLHVKKNGRRVKRWVLDDDRNKKLYHATHHNHPCNIWVRESSQNYRWTFFLFEALCCEFEYRRDKAHACSELLPALSKLPNNISIGEMTPLPLAMPEKYHCDNPIKSYRMYYNCEKGPMVEHKNKNMGQWNWGREKPRWVIEKNK